MNSCFRVVTEDPEVKLRSLVHSARQRNFGKKTLAPKTVNQRRYVKASEQHNLVCGGGPAESEGARRCFIFSAPCRREAFSAAKKY